MKRQASPIDLIESGWSWGMASEAREGLTLSFSNAWMGTPHVAGQRVSGAGVDCKELMVAYLDHLRNIVWPSRTSVPRIAQDAGMHSGEAAWGVLLAAVRAFGIFDVKEEKTVRTGDILVCASDPSMKGQVTPGHAMIALPRFGTALHATIGPGVCQTSLGAINGKVLRVMRCPTTSFEESLMEEGGR